MKELNEIIAFNISDLRKKANMTQVDLAEKLNYSDKAVSKWERGESVPDISILKKISDLFGVSVDYLLEREHHLFEAEKKANRKRIRFNRKIITMISIALVWFIAIFAYMNMDIFIKDPHGMNWLIFVYAVPVSCLVGIIFNAIWGKRFVTFILITVMLWSLLTCLYLNFLPLRNLWLLFTLGVPAQIIIILWSRLKPKDKN